MHNKSIFRQYRFQLIIVACGLSKGKGRGDPAPTDIGGIAFNKLLYCQNSIKSIGLNFVSPVYIPL